MAIVIADAGPVIALANIQQLVLLRGLFAEVTLPAAVWQETQVKDKEDSRLIEQARTNGWINVREVEIKRHFPQGLHDGESQALQLAVNEKNSLLIVDDRLARREANRLGLNFIGTVKVLFLAEHYGLITDARTCVQDMQAFGYRVSVEFLDGL